MSFGDLQAAYEGVDDLARSEPAALAAYRGDLLEPAAARSRAAWASTSRARGFGPAGLDAALLATLRAALAPGGLLCLELYRERRRVELARAGGGHVRIWDELAPSDPWRFYLSDVAYDEPSAVLTHAKTFIHREGEVDSGRVERLRVYEPDAISGLLEQEGFGEVETFAGWSGAPYERGEFLVVTSRTA